MGGRLEGREKSRLGRRRMCCSGMATLVWVVGKCGNRGGDYQSEDELMMWLRCTVFVLLICSQHNSS